MKMKRLGLLLIMGLVFLGIISCSNKNEEKRPIKAINSTITEGRILIKMIKLIVEKETDYQVDISDEITEVNAYKEVSKGNFDLFSTYDGTVLTTLLHLDPSDVPEGKTIYDYANEIAQQRDNVMILKKIGTNNTYVMAVQPEIAKKYNLKTTTDLVAVAPELTFGAEHGFFSEEGSMKYGPYTRFYGLKFKNDVQIDLNLKYAAIKNKDIDATVVYTTDGLNVDAGLVMLEDDRKYFPDYFGVLAVRGDLFEEYGENLKNVMNKIAGLLPNEKMVQLTYQVDVEMKSIDDVAKAFLKEQGLL